MPRHNRDTDFYELNIDIRNPYGFDGDHENDQIQDQDGALWFVCSDEALTKVLSWWWCDYPAKFQAVVNMNNFLGLLCNLVFPS